MTAAENLLQISKPSIQNLRDTLFLNCGIREDKYVVYTYLSHVFESLDNVKDLPLNLQQNLSSLLLFTICNFIPPESTVPGIKDNKIKNEINKEKMIWISEKIFYYDKFTTIFLKKNSLAFLNLLIFLQDNNLLKKFENILGVEEYLEQLIVIRQAVKAKNIKNNCNTNISNLISIHPKGIFVLKSVVLKNELLDKKFQQTISFISKIVMNPANTLKNQQKYFDNICMQLIENITPDTRESDIYYIFYLLNLFLNHLTAKYSITDEKFTLDKNIFTAENYQKILILYFKEEQYRPLFILLIPYLSTYLIDRCMSIENLSSGRTNDKVDVIKYVEYFKDLHAFFFEDILENFHTHPVLYNEEIFERFSKNISRLLLDGQQDSMNSVISLLFDKLGALLLESGNIKLSDTYSLNKLMLILSILQDRLGNLFDLKTTAVIPITLKMFQMIKNYFYAVGACARQNNSSIKSQTCVKLIQALVVLVLKSNIPEPILVEIYQMNDTILKKMDDIENGKNSTLLAPFINSNDYPIMKSQFVFLNQMLVSRISTETLRGIVRAEVGKKDKPPLSIESNSQVETITKWWKNWWTQVSNEVVPVKAGAYISLNQKLAEMFKTTSGVVIKDKNYMMNNITSILEVAITDLGHPDSYVHMASTKFIKNLAFLDKNKSFSSGECLFTLVINLLLRFGYAHTFNNVISDGEIRPFTHDLPFQFKINECLTQLSPLVSKDFPRDVQVINSVFQSLNRGFLHYASSYSKYLGRNHHHEADDNDCKPEHDNCLKCQSLEVEDLASAQSSALSVLSCWITALPENRPRIHVQIKEVVTEISSLLVHPRCTDLHLLNSCLAVFRVIFVKIKNISTFASLVAIEKSNQFLFSDIAPKVLISMIYETCHRYLNGERKVYEEKDCVSHCLVTNDKTVITEEDIRSHCVLILQSLDHLRN